MVSNQHTQEYYPQQASLAKFCLGPLLRRKELADTNTVGKDNNAQVPKARPLDLAQTMPQIRGLPFWWLLLTILKTR